MRIIGLLNWYQEPASWLAECVASAARICDHLIAVDGPYVAFPGAFKQPYSGAEQADIIMRTAAGAGMGCTIHQPRQPWWGNEIEKRDYMFRLGESFTTSDDWYLRIDADEVLTSVPPGTRDRLATSDFNTAEITIWQRENDPKVAARVDTGSEYAEPFRCLFRALPGISIKHAHYIVVTPDTVLRGRGEEPAEDLTDVRLEHRTYQRAIARQEQKQQYNVLINDFEETN